MNSKRPITPYGWTIKQRLTELQAGPEEDFVPV
jgi:hypothetical protein